MSRGPGPFIDACAARDTAWGEDIKVLVGPIRINLPDGCSVTRTVIFAERLSPQVLRLWLDEAVGGDPG